MSQANGRHDSPAGLPPYGLDVKASTMAYLNDGGDMMLGT